MKRKRVNRYLYRGVTRNLFNYELFRSEHTPTEQSHPQYVYVTGPFRTRKEAIDGWNRGYR